MKSYPKMKDSGVDWIGKIPEDWEVTRLKRILTLLKDGTHNPPSRTDNGVLLLSAENIRDGFIDYENNISYISEHDYNEMQRTYQIQKDDVLLTIVGTIGRCSIVKHDIKFSVQRSVAILRLIKEVEPKFLFYLIHGNLFQNQLFVGVNKAAQGGVYLGEIKNIIINLPKTKYEQNKIISFLDNQTSKIDSELEKNQKLVELLKEKRQAIIEQVVTKGLDTSVPMKDSGIEWIGEIPEHWEIQILKNYSTHITKGSTPTTYGFDWSDDQDDILFVRNECVKENQFNIEGSLRISKKAHDFMKRSKIVSGDILISITGEIGRSCIFPDELGEANINQHIARIHVILNKILPTYLVNLLNSKSYHTYFQVINQGLTHAHLNLEQVRNIKIISPPINEQKQISDFLEKETTKINSLILKAESHMEKLQEYRQSLISFAVTGKIDVREAVA